MNIADIQPFSLSDYPGQCAAIIFTIGCNFRCPYCHNKSLWNGEAKTVAEEKIMDFLIAKRGRLSGVVITGGEPTIQPDLESFIEKVKALGYLVKLDTNGAYPDVLDRLITKRLLDFIAMDIKAPFFNYNELTGVQTNIFDIKRSIRLINSSGIEHVFRTTWDKELLSEHDIGLIKKLLPIGGNFVIQEKTG